MNEKDWKRLEEIEQQEVNLKYIERHVFEDVTWVISKLRELDADLVACQERERKLRETAEFVLTRLQKLTDEGE